MNKMDCITVYLYLHHFRNITRGTTTSENFYSTDQAVIRPPWLTNAFIHKMWASDLILWAFVHVGLCPMGFCPCGLLSGYH